MVATLSNDAILKRKEETLNAQALRRTVPVREINLIDEKTIEYNGARITITAGAFKSLMKIIGMSKQFADKFEKLFNAEAKAQFINTMKNAMATNRGNLSQITVVLNPISKMVVNFTQHSNELISNSQFVEQAEKVIDRGRFDVVNWTTDPTTGIITLNAVNPNARWGVEGDANEVFTAGITLKNSPITGFQVSPYVNRMWCTNGLTAPLANDKYNLTSFSKDSLEKFNEYMQNLTNRNFMPTGFSDVVNKAKNTAASLKEMRWAHDTVKKAGAGERADQWIPLNQNELAYSRMGTDVNNLNAGQLSNARTDQSIWSLVNGITHFATHGTDIVDGVQDHDGTRLMVQAGNILGRTWDLGNQVPSPFNGLSENQVGAMLN